MPPFRITSRTLPDSRRPSGRPPPDAPPPVPVPWRVVGRSLGVIEVEHCGPDVAHSVRFALAGAGMLGLSLPRQVWPGERLRAVIRGAQGTAAAAAHDAMLVLRWFEPDGTELLWPIAVE